MNTREMARDYLRRAATTLQEARHAFDAHDAPLAVRRSQETVELALKAALRFAGVEYPREHDVGDVLVRGDVATRFPESFRRRTLSFARISAELVKQRGPAFYGDEARLVPPSALFGQRAAERAIRQAQTVFAATRRLVESVA